MTEWRSKALPRDQRLTKKAGALIAAVYLAGANTRRVKRALFGLFAGAVSKEMVSRAWRKVKVDRDAWCARSLADEDIVRLILDGTVIKTRLDRKATNLSVSAAIGARRQGISAAFATRPHKADPTACVPRGDRFCDRRNAQCGKAIRELPFQFSRQILKTCTDFEASGNGARRLRRKGEDMVNFPRPVCDARIVSKAERPCAVFGPESAAEPPKPAIPAAKALRNGNKAHVQIVP